MATPSLQIHRQDRLTPQQLTQCYNLIRQLRPMYISSGMGWNKQDKLDELTSEEMRYLLVFEESHSINGSSNCQSSHGISDPPNGSPAASPVIAFASYVPHTTEPIITQDMITQELIVTYLYEVHVSRNFRGTGIGRALVDSVRDEMIAYSTKGLMLTVFNANSSALRFYYRYGFKSCDNGDCTCWNYSINRTRSSARRGGGVIVCTCNKKGWRRLILANGNEKSNNNKKIKQE